VARSLADGGRGRRWIHMGQELTRRVPDLRLRATRHVLDRAGRGIADLSVLDAEIIQ